MKRIFSLLLVVVLMCTLFVGCSNKDISENPTEGKTETGENKEPTVGEETTQPTTEQEPVETQPSKSEEEKQAELEALYTQYLSGVNIELLSVDRALPWKESFWEDGYYVSQKYGGVGTMITIGIDWGSASAHDIAYGISICGETATDPDDPTKEAWQYDDMFTTEDDTYSIISFVVQGDVDTSKAHLLIKTKLENVYREFEFENEGQPVGYANAIERYSHEDDNMGMDSGIIKLKDRHYKVVLRRKDYSRVRLNSDNDDPNDGIYVYIEYKLGLLPLEKGNRESLSTEDVSGSYTDESLRREDMKFNYSVSRENVYGGADPIHTVLIVEGKYTVPCVAVMEDGYVDGSAYTAEEKELSNYFANLQFTTLDENSEVETVFQVLKAE